MIDLKVYSGGMSGRIRRRLVADLVRNVRDREPAAVALCYEASIGASLGFPAPIART